MAHWKTVCQYGVVHGQCRCAGTQFETIVIECSNDLHKPDPIAEGAWPTARQWMMMFLTRTPDKQLEMAERVIRNARTAAACEDRNHLYLIQRWEAKDAQWVALFTRVYNAWRSARHRAKQYRFLLDAVAQSPHAAGEGIPPSQSEPEALPSSDEHSIASLDDDSPLNKYC